MHSGKQYRLQEFLLWTAKDIFYIVLFSTIPVVLYELLGFTWLAIPWVPIAMLGTAAAFIAGFRNNATYNRVWDARQAWGAIVNESRTWGIMSRDFITNQHAKKQYSETELNEFRRHLIYRHIAWLTALRYQLRESRAWETMDLPHNRQYQLRNFQIAEHIVPIENELKKFLDDDELSYIMNRKNKSAQIIALQSKELKELSELGLIEDFRHMEMVGILKNLYEQQGKSERIKNFPYPRQFASINLFFIRIFVFMVPFGMLGEFAAMGKHFVWLTIPFSALVCWVFNSLEKVGVSTENPFEGGANDVPITSMARNIEIDLREMLGENDLPQAYVAQNNILL